MNPEAWKFQTIDRPDLDRVETIIGNPTDAIGLRIAFASGFAWVDMGRGWMPMTRAIRILESRSAQGSSG